MELREALGALLDLLRSKGVTDFSGPVEWDGGRQMVRVVLGPLQMVVEPPQPMPREEPRRDDGLTAMEAEALYLSSGGR